MASIDASSPERRARWAYERARVRRALLGVAPLLLVVAAAAWLGVRPLMVCALGAALLASGALLLWYGRDPGRAVLPGVLAGFLPLCCSLGAKHVGHACSGGHCMSWCVPACSVGGVAAGLFMAWYGLRKQRSAVFWVLATGLTVLTGALGCSCVGYAGVFGLAAGYALGMLPGFAARSLKDR